MKKIVFYIIIVTSSLLGSCFAASMFGDRNAHPTYLRMPKFPEHLQNPQAEAHGHIVPGIQATQNFQHYTSSKTEDVRDLHYQRTAPSTRQDEISGYSHMYGTSDSYGGLSLK